MFKDLLTLTKPIFKTIKQFLSALDKADQPGYPKFKDDTHSSEEHEQYALYDALQNNIKKIKLITSFGFNYQKLKDDDTNGSEEHEQYALYENALQNNIKKILITSFQKVDQPKPGSEEHAMALQNNIKKIKQFLITSFQKVDQLKPGDPYHNKKVRYLKYEDAYTSATHSSGEHEQYVLYENAYK